MEKEKKYDLAVIGAGPGGYVGAIRASQLGLKTVLLEKDKLGGICLNWGCIPSKALIHQAEIYRSLPAAEAWGIGIDRTGFRYQTVQEKSRQVADQVSGGVDYLMKKNGIDIIRGEARFLDKTHLEVSGGERVEAKRVLISTGSRPAELPAFPFDGKTVLSSNDALALTELPESLIILGGGAIGCEFAHIMNSFGVAVTLVEMTDQLLPGADSDTVQVLQREFKKRKIKVLTGTTAESMDKGEKRISLKTRSAKGKEKNIEAEKLLVVVGRSPVTEGLDLEKAEIERDEGGFIPTGDYYQTPSAGIYAAGDVIRRPMLAHAASKEAEIAVQHLAAALAGGREPGMKRIPDELIPAAVYTEPQIAGFGLTEKGAEAAGLKARSVTFPYKGAGKSVAMERSEGVAKLVFDPDSGEILGGHVAGAEATELIHELLLAKSAELLPPDIAEMVHAHPTLSETVMELMRAAEGWAVHA